MKKRLFSVKEAAEYINVATQTIYNWMSEGRCPIRYHKIGNLVKFDIIELEEYVNTLPKFSDFKDKEAA